MASYLVVFRGGKTEPAKISASPLIYYRPATTGHISNTEADEL
jgi:hypothetical protein